MRRTLSDVHASVDLAAALLVAGLLALALVVHAAARVFADDRATHERVERERALPIVGHGPMFAVYRALVPVARALAFSGVSANAVTIVSVAIAALASIPFALGHFGVGAALACVAGVCDVVDGIIARETQSSSALGRVLDTTADRYVDAFLLGGMAVYFRHDVALLVLVLVAIVGAFMVSYASSIERELGITTSGDILVPMRRPHRLAYLLAGATLTPITAHAFKLDHRSTVSAFPVVAAIVAIAVLANVSAVRRLVGAAREPTPRKTSRVVSRWGEELRR